MPEGQPNGLLEDLVDQAAQKAAQAAVEAMEAKLSAPALLDAQGAADLLALSKDAISIMAKRRSHGLPFIKLPNGRVRYERQALLEWAKGQS